MVTNDKSVKMVPVQAQMFESVGYCDASRHLYIKQKNGTVLCFEDVPRFRIQGLMTSPRKDGYYKVYIKDAFLSKETKLPGQL